MVDWPRILRRLQSFPQGVHNLESPCFRERIDEAELRLGTMPIELSDMLQNFNGGELFVDAMPFITLFGLSQPSDPPTSDWFIDRYTPVWRAKIQRPTDWAIALTNYGGLIVLRSDSSVGEWDSSEQTWRSVTSYSDWVERVLADGTVYLNE